MKNKHKIHKAFNCVQMKWDIQKQIAQQFDGIPDSEANRIQSERIAKNPILGPFLNKIRLLRREKTREDVGQSVK